LQRNMPPGRGGAAAGHQWWPGTGSARDVQPEAVPEHQNEGRGLHGEPPRPLRVPLADDPERAAFLRPPATGIAAVDSALS
jgi:hypothetical protein